MDFLQLRLDSAGGWPRMAPESRSRLIHLRLKAIRRTGLAEDDPAPAQGPPVSARLSGEAGSLFFSSAMLTLDFELTKILAARRQIRTSGLRPHRPAPATPPDAGFADFGFGDAVVCRASRPAFAVLPRSCVAQWRLVLYRIRCDGGRLQSPVNGRSENRTWPPRVASPRRQGARRLDESSR